MLISSAISVQAQEVSFKEDAYYRLTNFFLGQVRSLSVDPENNVIKMAPTGMYTGQLWKILPQGNNTYKLSCYWQGEGKVIDVINDGQNNRMILTDNANYSGQYWTIQKVDEGYFRLINGWQTEKSLDVAGSKTGDEAYLKPIGEFEGQIWNIFEVEEIEGATEVEDPRAKDFSFKEDAHYRFTNVYMGEGRSLAVSTEGAEIMMATTEEDVHQIWKLLPQGNGIYKLSNEAFGPDKVIDVRNDGENKWMKLSDNAGYSGQSWYIQYGIEGYFRLINGWQTEKALDCDPDINGSGSFLSPIGDYPGQFWEITKVEVTDQKEPEEPEETEEEELEPEDIPAGLKVGDAALGGIVFSIDESGQHGLVCQKEDIPGLMSFEDAMAACKASAEGGKNNWRLPTREELTLLYEKLRKSGKTHFDNEWYWTSEKYDEHNIYSVDLLHGQIFPHFEGEHSHVRAVRKF